MGETQLAQPLRVIGELDATDSSPMGKNSHTVGCSVQFKSIDEYPGKV